MFTFVLRYLKVTNLSKKWINNAFAKKHILVLFPIYLIEYYFSTLFHNLFVSDFEVSSHDRRDKHGQILKP